MSEEVPFTFVEFHIGEREEKRRSLVLIDRMDPMEPCEVGLSHRDTAR